MISVESVQTECSCIFNVSLLSSVSIWTRNDSERSDNKHPAHRHCREFASTLPAHVSPSFSWVPFPKSAMLYSLNCTLILLSIILLIRPPSTQATLSRPPSTWKTMCAMIFVEKFKLFADWFMTILCCTIKKSAYRECTAMLWSTASTEISMISSWNMERWTKPPSEL